MRLTRKQRSRLAKRRNLRRKSAAVTMASSVILLSLVPATSAFAATYGDVSTITISESAHVVQPGASVRFTANPTNANSNTEYQFWVQSPNGKWTPEQGWSKSTSFTLSDVAPGNYLVAVAAMQQNQISNHDWGAAVTSVGAAVFVDSHVSIGLSSTNVSAGTPITITASSSGIFNPVYQYWYEKPDGTWIQSGFYTNKTTDTFTPKTPGMYRVIVYAKSVLAPSNQQGALTSQVLNPVAVSSTLAVQVQAQSSSIPANGVTTDPVTATVTDINGDPIFDAKVGFSSSNPNVVQVPSVGVTNLQGQAVVSAESTQKTGSAVITASIDGVANRTTISTQPGSPANVSLTQSSSSLDAGSGVVDTITALVTDSNGNPVPGQKVTFTSSNANVAKINATNVVTTDSAGKAITTAIAGSAIGQATITGALSDNLTGTTVVKTTTGSASTISSTLSSALNVTAGQVQPVSFTVTDSNGNPVNDASVSFAVTGTLKSSNLSGTSGLTDSSGKVTVSYLDTNAGDTGAIMATLSAGELATSSQLTIVPASPASIGSFSYSNRSVTPPLSGNGPVTDAISTAPTVRDAYGNVLTKSGTYTLTGPATSSVTIDKSTGALTIPAGAKQGAYVVTYTQGNVSSPPVTVNVGSASGQTISLSGPSSAIAGSNQPFTIKATVVDGSGNPVSNATVTFSSTDPSRASVGSSNSQVAMTNSAGQTEITVTPGSQSGSVVIYGVLSSGIQGQADVTMQPGSPAIVGVEAASSSVVANSGTSDQLSATVTDANGNPIAGATVTFATSDQTVLALPSTNTATTNALGVATVMGQAGTSTGQAVVTASVSSGIAGTTTISSTVGSVAHISTTTGGASITAGQLTKAVFKVIDANGNPMPGATVNFGVTGSLNANDLGVSSAKTNASGMVAVSYLDKVAGDSGSVTGSLNGYSASTGQLTIIPGSVFQVGAFHYASATVTPPSAGNGPVSDSISTAPKVTDAYGNNITPSGTYSLTGPTNSTVSIDKSTGQLSIPADAIQGAYTVTYTDSGVTSVPVTVNVASASANTVNLAAQSSALTAGSSMSDTVTATVTDANGNPVPNSTVTFSSSNSKVASVGTNNSAVVSTNSAGQATISVTPGTQAGTVVITGTLGSGVQGEVDLSVTPGSAATVAVAAQHSAIQGTGTSDLISATVTDKYGNPVPGATVTFTSNSSALLSVPSSATTNQLGVATVQSVAGSGDGNATVTANASNGTSGSTTVAVTTDMAVTNIQADVTGYGQENLTWSLPVSSNTPSQYEVYLTPSQAGEKINGQATTSTTPIEVSGNYLTAFGNGATIMGLSPGGTYTANITAIYSDGTVVKSQSSGQFTVAGAPANVAVGTMSSGTYDSTSDYYYNGTVTVTDQYGNPVSNLTGQDFTVVGSTNNTVYTYTAAKPSSPANDFTMSNQGNGQYSLTIYTTSSTLKTGNFTVSCNGVSGQGTF